MATAKKKVETESADMPVPAKEKVVKGNIDNLAKLEKEFKTNKMPAKKVYQLKEALMGLVKSSKATRPERELLETILRKQRAHTVKRAANIEDKDKFWLNQVEQERLDTVCTCKTDSAPQVLKLSKDLECKYDYDSDNEKFIVYIPEIIPSELQISRTTRTKEAKGHPVDPSAYPEDKTIIHRMVCPPKEFNAWFDINEDALSSEETSEEEYSF